MLRINLWSGPRNVSTALMYAFAQREDTRVVDEPLYAHYLRESGAIHPGGDEVLRTMDANGERVVREVILGPCDRPVLFIKNMGHHFTKLDWHFMKRVTTALLIRDPREMLPSLINQVLEPDIDDTAIKRQVEIFMRLAGLGKLPCVLDAKELLLDPRSVLEQFCAHVGLKFDPAMLSWPQGPRPEEGVWAPHWYHRVHETTGFAPYRAKTDPFPEFLRPLLAECRPYYEFLYSHAIKA